MVQVDRPVVRMFTQGLITVRWETRIEDAHSLGEYQVQFERQLLSNRYGVVPHSERRSGYDRRRQPRTLEDRRKQ